MFSKNKIVSCDECKCLVNKYDAQEIMIIRTGFFLGSIASDGYKYMCMSHKKPYHKEITGIIYSEPYSYRKEMEVDKNGEPIGYVKSKSK